MPTKRPKLDKGTEGEAEGQVPPRADDEDDEDGVGAFVEAERARLVMERQAGLQAVTTQHDALLREMFHLEKFVSMLVFDPETARTDKSAVFEAWRAQRDLLQTTTSAAGPSRATRRGQTARLQALHGSTSRPAGSTSISVSAPPSITPHQSAPVGDDNLEIWNLIARRRGKGKESVDVEDDEVPVQPEESISTVRRGRPPGRPPKKHRKDLFRTTSPAPLRSIKVRVDQRVHRPTISPSPSVDVSSPRPQKRRKNTAASSSRIVADSSEPPDMNASGIKRVKLIVRRPAPRISHPWQQSRAKLFNGKLSDFLSSYTLLDDTDADEDELAQTAEEEARLRQRVASLRRQGRLVERPADWTSDDEEPPGGYDGNDVWSAVTQDVIAAVKDRFTSTSRRVASRVAAKVEGYWEGVAAKEAKERAAEEKQLRQLAKVTAKLVVGEWKKVVFHIKEQERLRVEEEERQRNREHLNAILTQSGQILRAQHQDLSKVAVRSRSSSMFLDALDDDEVEPGQSGDEMEDESGGETEQADDDDVSGPPPSLSAASFVSATEHPDSPNSSLANLDAMSTSSAYENDVDLMAERGPPALSSSSSATSRRSPSDARSETSPSPRSISMDVVDSIAPLVRSASETTDDAPATTSALLPFENTKSDAGIISARVVDSPVANAPESPVVGESEEPTADESREDAPMEELDASIIPHYLRPYAVAPVVWDPNAQVAKPLLLRGILRPYQQEGLEWLASLNSQHLNGILADEMGLGKTIQTIALLAHLACDRGIWGPHLIIVPTSVLLNWCMEFKKFLPGFKVLSYHGTAKQRQELRKGWNDKYSFNVCVTSYTLAAKDSHIFKRKPWYYMILDEAHMIKNFRTQRWNTLLAFRSFRRLLLTGTPVQNNLTELWALLQFLLYGTDFAGHQQFADWFSDPLEKAIEAGETASAEVQARAAKLHELLQPYILRRMKAAVEQQLPNKYEHIVRCPLSKRQRLLYDEFMSRRTTRADLGSGAYHRIANVLMQLRKVCNHPDLFEVRPIESPFAVARSAAVDFEIKELLVRRRLLNEAEECVNLEVFGLRFIDDVGKCELQAAETRRLDATHLLPGADPDGPGPPPPHDLRTIAGHTRWRAYQARAATLARWTHIAYLNALRCSRPVVLGRGALASVRALGPKALVPLDALDTRFGALSACTRVHALVLSYPARAAVMHELVERFACVPPAAVAQDLARLALPARAQAALAREAHLRPTLGSELHGASTRRMLAFPDAALLQHDCGKLQALATLLKERQRGGHRALIFTQMTRVLDILERFLSLHGWVYLRLDGATKVEERQYLTERFNADARIFCFISSSRSGGVGINLTGADTVIFFDSDFNPQMDRQCEDRAHRIGQARDVHIFRFCAAHTVEEALQAKAGQKRALDALVIQQGAFDWRALLDAAPADGARGGQAAARKGEALVRAMAEVEDGEDRWAASVAEREVREAEGAEVEEFGAPVLSASAEPEPEAPPVEVGAAAGEDDEEEEGGTVVEYMLKFVSEDLEFFEDWRV